MINKYIHFSILLVLLATLIIPVGKASALTISQTLNYDGVPNYDSVLTFNKWWNPGATLQSVEISMDLNIDGGVLNADNDSLSAGTVTFTLGANGNLTGAVPLVGGGRFSFPAMKVNTKTNIYLLANNGDVTNNYDNGIPGTDWGSYSGVPMSDSDSMVIDQAYHGFYTGLGTFDLEASLSQYSNVTGLTGLSFSTSPVYSFGSVTVKYVDDAAPPAVPEPATLLLLGSGIAGLIGVSRRGRQEV